jgi:transposase
MFYEVKAIARAKIKTDKRDSEVLAHLLRMNMIPEVYRRSTENRQAQRVLRQRAFYVSAMTALSIIAKTAPEDPIGTRNPSAAAKTQ